MTIEKVREIAIQELLAPTWALTKQFLSTFQIEKQNEIPVIARIDTAGSDGRFVVYVPVKNERFYLAFYFDTIEQIELKDVGTEAGTNVYLWIEDSSEISKDDFPYKPINNRGKGFTYSLDPCEPDELEDKLNQLIDKLESEKERFLEFSNRTYISLNVAYYGYKEQMWGLHLDKKIIKRLADLNIDFDLDIYAGGPDLKE